MKTVLLFGQDADWLLSGGKRLSFAVSFLPQLAASPAGALEVLSVGIHGIIALRHLVKISHGALDWLIIKK